MLEQSQGPTVSFLASERQGHFWLVSVWFCCLSAILNAGLVGALLEQFVILMLVGCCADLGDAGEKGKSPAKEDSYGD